MRIPFLSKREPKEPSDADLRGYWSKLDRLRLSEDDQEASAAITAHFGRLDSTLTVEVRRSFRKHRHLVFHTGRDDRSEDLMLRLFRQASRPWSFRVMLGLNPSEDWTLSYRWNREFLQACRYAPNWSVRPMFGQYALDCIHHAIVCQHVGREDLMTAWLAVSGQAISEAWRYWDEVERHNCDRPEISYLWLADALHTLANGGDPSSSRALPFAEAIEASGGSGSDYDCMRLFLSLLAVAVNDAAAYDAVQELRWKKDPECAAERALARALKQALQPNPPQELWQAYVPVLNRWRARSVLTDSDAMLYQEVLRDALCFTWVIKKCQSASFHNFVSVLRDGPSFSQPPNYPLQPTTTRHSK